MAASRLEARKPEVVSGNDVEEAWRTTHEPSRWRTFLAGEKCWIVPSDTPFVVQMVRADETEGVARALTLILNASIEEALDPASLSVGKANVLYTTVKKGAFPARFTLPSSASDAWAVDGRWTDTGAPLLAGDPHLSFDFPGLWYLARIETPGHVLAGATGPGRARYRR